MDMDARLTGAEAANRAGVTRQLVYRWRLLGHLNPVAYNQKGHPLYRWGDVLKAELTTRKSPMSRRAAMSGG